MQFDSSKRHSLPATPWRALVFVLVGLVLGLSFASVSPETHALIHAGTSHASCDHADAPAAPAHDEDHLCAVVLFAQGVELPVTDQASPAHAAWQEATPLPFEELLLLAPRYLRHPERGPPLA